MTLRRCVLMVFGSIPVWMGCAPKRVHIMPEVAQINRVAVVNLADRTGKPSPESEFFTNEFVSLGFSVVERGHLQEVIKEAFTSTGYLDERSVAQWGRGLGIEAVVLHQIVNSLALDEEGDDYEVSGWVRMVDVETGKIIMTYNAEVRAGGTKSASRAARLYAQQVVDDIRLAMQQQKVQPSAVPKVKVQQQVEVKQTQVKP